MITMMKMKKKIPSVEMDNNRMTKNVTMVITMSSMRAQGIARERAVATASFGKIYSMTMTTMRNVMIGTRSIPMDARLNVSELFAVMGSNAETCCSVK